MNLEEVLLLSLGGEDLLALLLGVSEEGSCKLWSQGGDDLPHEVLGALVRAGVDKDTNRGLWRVREVAHQGLVLLDQLVEALH